MAKKNSRREQDGERAKTSIFDDIHPDIKRSVFVIVAVSIGIIFVLAGAGQAGPLGAGLYDAFSRLFGWGYYLFPIAFFLLALSFLSPEQKKFLGVPLIGGVLFVLSGLGLLDVISPGSGGLTGSVIGLLKNPFGLPTAIVITATALIASFLLTINRPIRLAAFLGRFKRTRHEDAIDIKLPPEAPGTEQGRQEDGEGSRSATQAGEREKNTAVYSAETAAKAERENAKSSYARQKKIKNYVPPPLSLLVSSVEKPTIGDLRANANIIKRTLEGFGISVEMGEISVGPTVTRYTLKPAEGVKLSRITALNPDLALALAAHPIRIEAPIPGKSLVGIEVPNKAAAVVHLGSLLLYPEFQKSDPLTFALGRNVNGEPIMPDIARMPHLLIAGATGSGKSITIHSIIISLLFRNSPDMLRLILVDPKRVELSIYEGLPHLIAPIVTENKKAISAFRWLIKEMEDRYQILLEAGARDIQIYNKHTAQPLSYLVLIIDELADLMTTYGREIEGSIIRLAQMARATGIHLIVSTQRPSVEVITGLIKANITTRIALQVASQIDSRTILDTAGAEKLLGNGDLLFVSSELSKPRRIQGSYVSEDEVKKVVEFIIKNNQPSFDGPSTVSSGWSNHEGHGLLHQNDYEGHGELFDNITAPDEEEDELLNEAIETVRAAQKASASLLQRRLKVGYARAARLLDIMEERGIVGPGEGAKPREVYIPARTESAHSGES